MAIVCTALVACVTAVLWPSVGFAAILPACENDFESRPAAAPSEQPELESCEALAARGDEIDNSRAAPICDSRGASAVAPPRIRGVPDIRFEQSRPCNGDDEVHAAVSPGRGDPPAPSPDVHIERIVLPGVLELGPAPEARLIDPLAPTDGPREGVRDSIYHPPR